MRSLFATPRTVRRPSALLLVAVLTLSFLSPVQAQPANPSATAELDQQRAIAERFLQVLLRRPRPGTALDRVYGYHIQAGTLDQLFDQLRERASAGGDDAAAHWMLLGLLQLQRGEDAAAAESLGKAEPLTDDAMASYELGRALLLVGQTDAAAAALERSIERGPARNEALPVFTELGRIYGRAGQHEKAIAVWSKLEELFPGDQRVGEQIARTLADEGQPEVALERYLQLAKSTEASDSYRAVGFAISAAELKRRLGRDEEALQDLEQLLGRLRPGSWLHSDVRRRIEAGFLRDGDYSALADYYAQQLEQDPDDLDARMRFGRALSRAGRINESIETLEAAVERAPDDADVRLELINVLRGAGRYSDVAGQLRTLSQQNPENPDYYIQLGNALLEDDSTPRDERRAAAAEVWQQLADRRAEDAVTTAQVADLMRRIENVDAAITLYRRAIDLAPNEPQFREYLGEYLHGLDRKEEALATWQSLAEGDRRNREALIRRAEVFNTFGYPEKALDSFAAAAELDPAFAERLRFAALLAQAQRFNEALDQLAAAERIAETPEEHEQILQQRISVYGSSGTLPEQIAAVEQRTGGDQATAEDFRQLALMQNAASRNTAAMAAIAEGVERAPRDVGVLGVAAELYRQNSRFADAIAVYRQLATLDARFQTSYLQRIAELQMRLGKVDEALATARELIAASPGSPSAYRTYADFCFQAGRDDEGIETLRRALRTAPRDEEARRALASALAQRFRTDEAIELYWQSFDAGGDLEDRQTAVTSLAPLYERKADLSQLISRLEQFGRENSDVRQAALLIAHAYKTTGDLGSAKETLQPLLADTPRDVELLSQMSQLSDAADEPQLALEYQQQIVALADTPEHRARLLSLMVDAGQIDAAMAAFARLQSLTELESVVRMIDRTLSRREFEAAAAMCRETLDRHSGLWEVKIRLALCLLADSQDENDGAAMELAEQVRGLRLPDETRAASSPEPKKSPGQRSAPPGYARLSDGRLISTSVTSYSRTPYQLAASFSLGRYGRSSYSSLRSTFQLPALTTYEDARHCATGILLAHGAKRNQLEETFAAIVDVADLDSVTNPGQLWDAHSAALFRAAFRDDPSNTALPDDLARLLVRRLTQVNPERGVPLFINMLQSRQNLRARPSAAGGEQAEKPLEQDELAVLPSVLSYLQTAPAGYPAPHFYALVYREWKLAGRDREAEQIVEQFKSSPDELQPVVEAMQFFIAIEKGDAAARQLERARKVVDRQLEESQAEHLQSLATAALQLIEHADDKNTWTAALNDAIRFWSLAGQLDPRNRSSYASSRNQQGTVTTYRVVNGRGTQLQMEVPFAASLLDSTLARQLYLSIQADDEDSERRKVLVDWLLENELDETAAPHHQLLYGCCGAFVAWWIDDVESAYRRMSDLAERFPTDIDVHIEKARLAAELNRPRESLAALDAVQPLDQQTLQTRELAAMNLAIRLGELERARSAARRLFGMRLNSEIQLAMVDQLNRLGMQDMSRAMLIRMRRRGGQNENQLLAIAQKFKAAGEADAAAEAAYQVLRRLNAGRSSNNDYYRRQTLQILAGLGRLDKIIEQAERRAQSAPKSLTLQSELAELYTAAGRGKQADEQLERVAQLQPNDPRVLIQTAARLSKLGKHSEALDKYLAAFEQDLSLVDRHIYEMQQVANEAKRTSDVYETMLQWDLRKISSYRLGDLLNSYRRYGNQEVTPQIAAFFEKVVDTVELEQLGHVLRDLRNESVFSESPKLAIKLGDLFAADDIFTGRSQFWQSNSYSSGGTINNALEPCLRIICGNDPLETAVRKSLKEKSSREATQPVADAVLIALDVAAGEEADIAARVDALLAATKEEKAELLPPEMLWTIGQMMENTQGLLPTSIKLFERARAGLRDSSFNNYRFGLGAKLIDAYSKAGAGYRDKAVTELMKGFRETDNNRGNQYNPGYGDYQDLESWQSIAQKLIQQKAPFEAIEVYNHALARPEKFVLASRWSGSRNWEQTLQDGLRKAIDSLTVEARINYVRGLATNIDGEPRDTESQTSGTETLRLGAFAPGQQVRGAMSSIAAVAILGLAEHSEGAEALQQLDDRLERIKQSSDEKTRRAGLALSVLIAAERKSTLAADRLRELAATVPAVESVTEPSREMLQLAGEILPLYSIAIVALESEDPALVAAGDELCGRIIPVARESESLAHVRALAMARLRSAGSENGQRAAALLRETLDVILPPAEEPGTVNSSRAIECLEIARAAVEAGDNELSMEAVRRALAGGAPLTAVSGSTAASAFVLPTTPAVVSSSSSSDGAGSDLIQLAETVIQLVDTWTESGASEQAIYETLVSVVMPRSRPGEMFSYRLPLFSMMIRNTQAAGTDPKAAPAPKSAANVLAAAAASAGRVEDLRSRLRMLREGMVNTWEADILLLQLARAAGDEAEQKSCIESLAASVDSRLPTADQLGSLVPPSDAPYVRADTPDTQLVDALLHAVVPALDSTQKNTAADQLVMRTLGFALSQREPLQRSTETFKWIVDRLLQRLHDRGASQQLETLVQLQLTLVEGRYGNYSGNYGQQQAHFERQRLAARAVDFGAWYLAADLTRQFAGDEPPFRSSTTTGSAATLALGLLDANPADRYRMLARLAFGPDGDQPLVKWDAYLLYEEPPEELVAQTPTLEEVRQLRPAHPFLPIVSTADLLAEVAVRSGNAQQLLVSISKENSFDGDELDAFAGLIKLYQGDSRAAADALARVSERLSANSPTESDSDLAFPTLAAILAARCLEAEIEPDAALDALETLQNYARRGHVGRVISSLDQVLARNGRTRAAGATPGSPLEHWLVMPVPPRGEPLTPAMQPLYRFAEGSVRTTGGQGDTAMMLRYPIHGDFTYRHTVDQEGWGEANITYGGIKYAAEHWAAKGKVIGLASRGQYDFPTEWQKNERAPVNEIEVSAGSVVSRYNGETILTDQLRPGMPFLGVVVGMNSVSQFRDIEVSGEISIPRAVDLIGPQLAGWATLYYGGSLPDLHLPLPPDQNAGRIAEQRQQYLDRQHEISTWHARDGHLVTGERPGYFTKGEMRHINYLRPLCAGESLTYEFLYEPEKSEVHPTVGRIAVLLRSEGPRLRWLAIDGSLESAETEPLHEVAPRDLLLDAADPMPLKESDWNSVTLTVDDSGQHLTVALNGTNLCRVSTPQPQPFGLLAEKGRTVDVRAAALTGPWPEKLPDDLMEAKK